MRRSGTRRWSALVCVLVAGLVSGAFAQVPDGALTGTLAKARTRGEVLVGYRDASIPLSYASARGEPIGYAIDICRAIVDAMSTEVGRELVIRFVPVTSESRMNAVTS